ncbi:MAG: hypothetical protein D4R43_01175 [Sphingobacteriales bacterium]|nr:MAG: hypothetical protein D4R43_01175 [Sphingobacteriales bacterium]
MKTGNMFLKYSSWFYIGVLTLIISCNPRIQEENISYKYSRQYLALYPPAGEIFYSKLERVKRNDQNICGLNIYLTNTLSDFKAYYFQINNSKSEKSDGKIFIPFFSDSLKLQKAVLYIWASTENATTKEYSMNITYEPKQLFRSAGKSSYSNDLITIGETDLVLVEKQVSDFIIYSPATDEINFARKEFTNNKSTEANEVEIIAKKIIKNLSDHQGTPSDSMDGISSFAQYQRAMEGKDKVWCGNFADIFSYAGACLNIPIRRIGLGSTYDSIEDPVIMNAEGHTTTEVYDIQKKEWYLVDLTFNLLKVYVNGKENHPLNFIEFYYSINDPLMEKLLMIEEYNTEKNEVLIIPITESRFYHDYKKFYKLNQRFAFGTKNGFI